MKVIGFQNHRDDTAAPGAKFVHLAVLACGHTQRVAHGHVPKDMPCPHGCQEPKSKSRDDDVWDPFGTGLPFPLGD